MYPIVSPPHRKIALSVYGTHQIIRSLRPSISVMLISPYAWSTPWIYSFLDGRMDRLVKFKEVEDRPPVYVA